MIYRMRKRYCTIKPLAPDVENRYRTPMNNYHTHTWRCKHADGTVEDYAKEALKAGIDILGISDHTPLPDNRWLFVRMAMNEFTGYLEEIERAKENVREITILKGLECDWSSEYADFYRDELLGMYNLDYLIGAVHWFPYQGQWLYAGEIETSSHLKAFSTHVIKAMESGLFSFIAHPDSFGIGYRKWDGNAVSCASDIISAAKELDVILEINGYGLRKPEIDTPDGKRKQYPLLPFWEIAGREGITAICNSDAHTPQDVGSSLRETMGIARKFSVKTTGKLPVKVGR